LFGREAVVGAKRMTKTISKGNSISFRKFVRGTLDKEVLPGQNRRRVVHVTYSILRIPSTLKSCHSPGCDSSG
jgi:hypothetical protein